jgi:PAS domain S-box-containing protein
VTDPQTQLVLVGPAATALEERLRPLDIRFAAVVDLAGPEREARVASVRARCAPVVGILEDAAPLDGPLTALLEQLDGFVRAANAATDLPALLKALSQRGNQRLAAEREMHLLRRYEDVFSHVIDGMAVLDESGCVLSLNPAGCVTLGVSSEQAVGMRFEETVAPESAMAAALIWRELWRGGRVLAADLEVQTRNGRRITLSVSAGRLRSQHARAIVSFRDVTESRQLQIELRQTKEFLERLIDATPEGVVAADLRGRVLLWNKGAERVTGFTAAEVVGHLSVGDLYPPGQASALMAMVRAARTAGDDPAPIEGELVAKSGELVPVSLSVALVTEGARETATVGIFRDLREELRVEAELALTRDRLAVAEKAALVSELAGAAAHELNQPLTSVMGFSELLYRRTGENDRGREELGAILREAERMAMIVRKIGRIVRYETAPYLGSRRIVDLDKSSDPPPVKSGDTILISKDPTGDG